MKKMLTVLAIAFATTAMAQGGSAAGNHEKMTVEKRLEQMTTDLNLTKSQKKKVKALLEEQDKQHEKNSQADGNRPAPGRNNNSTAGERPPRGERPNGQEASGNENRGPQGNSEFDTKLKKILTTAQWKKWEAKKQEKEKSFQQNGNHKRPGNAPTSNNNDYRK